MAAKATRPIARWAVPMFVTCLLAPAAQAGPGIKVSGWVWGMKPGDAVTLFIQGPARRQVTARPGGAWSAEGLPPGEYKVTPRSPGYSFQPPSRSVKPGTGGLSSVNFRAAPPAAPAATGGFAIRGRVRGLPAAERVLVRADGPTRTEVMTRPGGLYTLTGLSPGTYQIEVVDSRFAAKPAGRTVKVTRADRTNIHFTAKRRPQSSGRIELKVKPRTIVRRHLVRGRVEGLKALLYGCTRAAVFARSDKETFRVSTVVSEDVRACGRFVFRDVPEGVYRITVEVGDMGMSVWESSPSSRKVKVTGDVDGIVFEMDQRERRTHRSRGRRRR